MKISCPIFFFVLTLFAQLKPPTNATTISADLIHFKQTLDEAANALENVVDSPAISDNAALQRQRRQAIDDLINNSEYGLNLNLQREALGMEDEVNGDEQLSDHPVERRDIGNENNKNNNNDLKGASGVNDPLNELVRTNTRFQNLHRQLLNSFHNSNRNLKFDSGASLQKEARGNEGRESGNKETFSDKQNDKGQKENKENSEKSTNNGSPNSNSYSETNENTKERTFGTDNDSLEKDNHATIDNWKPSFDSKYDFNAGVDYTKEDSVGTDSLGTQTFSKFDFTDNLKADENGNLKSGQKNVGMASHLLNKAYISCKPLISNTAKVKPESAHLEFTSDLHKPSENHASDTQSNLDTNLLLEANAYRNALKSKNAKEYMLEELNEKKVDSQMHKMLEKVDFPHFRLDFDATMEDYARTKASNAENNDDDEPISYEKTIENIHFPSIVNHQFDLGRNDLSHEANYKLSKIEQERAEPHKTQARGGEEARARVGVDSKLKVPWKRSPNFNPMDEIKLKTSARLMAKGFGASLPSYALSENQNELQLDEAVKELEKNFEAGAELGSKGYNRYTSAEELDWLERLKNLESAEQKSVERLIGADEATEEKEEKREDVKEKGIDGVLLGPTYSILRKRKISEEPEEGEEEDEDPLADAMRTGRVAQDAKEDKYLELPYSNRNWPEAAPLAELDEIDRAALEEMSAPEAAENEEDVAEDARTADVFESDAAKDMDMPEEELNYSELSVKNKRLSDEKSQVDTDKSTDSNVAKRRVKRIDQGKDESEKTETNELKTKRAEGEETANAAREQQSKEVEGTSSSVEIDTKAESESNEKEAVKEKILRRRKRDLTAMEEVYEDDSLHNLNGVGRVRRCLKNKSRHRLKREAEKTNETEDQKEKSNENETGKEQERSTQLNDEKKDNEKETTNSENEANVDDIDDNNSNMNRKFMNTAQFLSKRANDIPRNAYTEEQHATQEKTSELADDAAAIAADRQAMSAARFAERAHGNGKASGENYDDEVASLRRPFQRNRARGPERARERERARARQRTRTHERVEERQRARQRNREENFENSVGEFGNQVFDNLKQSDQNARHFDGLPIDNLWYGSDQWEDDKRDENSQKDDAERDQENAEELTIKLEDGEIKSIERKDEPPNKGRPVGVVNDNDEDYDNSEDALFGWFGKSKSKTNKTNNANKTNSGTLKTDENGGLVLKLNDQLLNCTAFNTLENFLRSSNKSGGSNDNGNGAGSSDNTIAQGGSGKCEGRYGQGADRYGNVGDGYGRQGNERNGMGNGQMGHNQGGGNYGGGNQGGGNYGGGKQGGGNHGDGNQRGGNQGNGGQAPGGMAGMGCGRNGGSEQRTNELGSGNQNQDRQNGYGLGRPNGGDTIDGTSNSEEINMTIEILPVSYRPPVLGIQKPMKLNITINASVMGDQKAKNFYGNGTFKVQSEERERRGIVFPPQLAERKRYAGKRLRKCPKPKIIDESVAKSKGALDVVKSMLNTVRSNPQMKPLWSSLKRNQECLRKAPPTEGGFEKMQREDINHIEDMVEQAMEAISDIIDDQVQQRSCIPLPPELTLFYEQILEIYDSNAAEAVREKRAESIDNKPFDEFAKLVRLIDPNSIEERSRIVKKLLRQYDDLPAEQQQQMVGVREDLQENLSFLERVKAEQTQKKREEMAVVKSSEQAQLANRDELKAGEQVKPLEPEQEQAEQLHEATAEEEKLKDGEQEQPLEPEQEQAEQLHESAAEDGNGGDTDTDIQRELIKRLEAEKGDDQELLKAYKLPYTPEFLRLLKATELMQEQEMREAEPANDNGN